LKNERTRILQSNRLTGLIAATFTPMHADGSLNLAAVPAMVDQLISDGVSGLYVVGSTGEGVSMTGAERKQTAEAFVRATGRRIPVVVQVGHNSIAEARELAAHAEKIGADGVSATPPSYFKPANIDLLVKCVAEIAGGAPDLPFYYYNIPVVTGVSFDMVEVMRRCGDAVKNFRGIKYTAPTLWEYQSLVELDGGRFDCLYGTDEMLLSSLVIGARGAVGTTYNMAAPLYNGIIAAFERGDLAEARRLQGLSVAFIRIAVKYRALPAFKAMMKMIGHDCGPFRLPHQSLTTAEAAALQQELQAIGFFGWARPKK
jgi:N-acetylneuraminate lyase